MPHPCPLCNNKSEDFHLWKTRVYYRCSMCRGIFVDKTLIPNAEEEKQRYLEHNNDANDIGYQSFVSPITNAIMLNFSPEDSGLDFGSGTGSSVSKILTDNNYNIKQYDPFFDKHKNLLNQQYDYIASCEVVEHFHNPLEEFKLLKKLLKPKGILYIKTEMYTEEIDFHTWYYKNDLTHVFIYHADSLKWICDELSFKSIDIQKKLITFFNH